MTTNSRYHPSIDKYMSMVESGEIESCKEQKLLMKYLQTKLKDAVIKSDLIDKAIRRMNQYFDGELMPWQEFITAFVFGVYDQDDTIMFNEFLIMMGRGGGKTGFMSRIEMALVTTEPVKKYHVDIVATSEDQSRESFDEFWEILDDDKQNNQGKKFRKYFYFTKEQYIFKKTRSRVRYRTNNAKTKDGGRQGAVIFDEIHAYDDEESIKVFISGLGKKDNPRRFYFTTDGYNRGGFLDMLKDESVLILNGDRPNRKTFPFICKLDDAEEVHDHSKWEKANPSLNYFPALRQEMMDEYEKLEDRGSSMVEFMTKRMNIPMNDSHESVTTWENILEANEELINLNGMNCIGGIDYADTTDFVVVGLLFKVEDIYYWKSHTFICHRALQGRNYKVPIDVGVKEGRITIIHDDIISPSHVSGWFIKQSKKYRIKDICTDMYRISYLSDEFEKNGFNKLTLSRSGSRTHTELEPFVNEIFAFNRIKWGKDFMMNWYTWNTYKHRDGKGNMTYEKIEPKLRKTDGFMALLHALQHRDKLNVPVVKIRKSLKTYTY
ncbi:terminase TerL endonuclease subunit [Facklamia sp. P12945]|uniref:terminase TerL endonuclease subunit n=1 Tax=Facklamia sp. P12945 TaxID=3421950 RepID=UPI003D178B70